VVEPRSGSVLKEWDWRRRLAFDDPRKERQQPAADDHLRICRPHKWGQTKWYVLQAIGDQKEDER